MNQRLLIPTLLLLLSFLQVHGQSIIPAASVASSPRSSSDDATSPFPLKSESQDETRNEKDENRKKFRDDFAFLFNDSAIDLLDIANDSSEVDDKSEEKKEFVKNVGKNVDRYSQLKNIQKAPKYTKKHHEVKEIKKFVAESSGNSSFFQKLTQLYDHFEWNVTAYSSVSPKCLNEMNIYINALRNGVEWAVQASDASGRYRGLFYFDNDFWLGSKQECYQLARKKARDVTQLGFFVTKVLIVMNKLPRLMQIGQCLPTTCTPEDVTEMLKSDPAWKVINRSRVTRELVGLDESFTMKILDTKTVPGAYDATKDVRVYVLSLIIVTVISLVAFATIYEHSLLAKGYQLNKIMKSKITEKGDAKYDCELSTRGKHLMDGGHNNNNNVVNNNNNKVVEECSEHNKTDHDDLTFKAKFLLCFAFGSNSKAILNTDKIDRDSLSFIHGLRFFTILWTILVHTYLQMFGVGENKFARKISEGTLQYQIVGNATFSVDTFFFLSGLLIVLLFFKTAKKSSQDNDDSNESERNSCVASVKKLALLVFYRFLRLTPIYLFVIIFTEVVMRQIYNDSVFTPALTDHINCNKYWWRNILYINNFYPLTEMCMMWSWYLANDFQFYVVTIILLISSRRFFRLSVFLSVLLLGMSLSTSFLISLKYKYVHKVAEPFESFDFLYDKPWHRFGPYAMGMFAGYILYRVKVPPKLTILARSLLWMSSISLLSVLIFGVPSGKISSITMTALYVSFGHAGWGLALMWITLSCVWGLSEPVNRFLSYRGFLPFSRLTYCTYLIHPTIMMMTSFQCDGGTQLKHGMIFTMFLGNAVAAFVFAFILSVLFEAPVIRVSKLFVKA